MSDLAFDRRPIDIIIPFYRNAKLVSSLFQSLQQISVRDELTSLNCSLIVVNDSPDDDHLRKCLQQAMAPTSCNLPCHLIENEKNIGFVQSVNKGLRLTLERKHDAILLNSDTILYPGAITEMRAVAHWDPMIGFVSPRSNNAAICSLPQQRIITKKLPPRNRTNSTCSFRNFFPAFTLSRSPSGFACSFVARC